MLRDERENEDYITTIKCGCCDEPVEDKYYEINSFIVCENCIEDFAHYI